MLPEYLSDHQEMPYEAKTVAINNLRVSYLTSASPYSVLNMLWAQVLVHVARQDPTLVTFTAEQQDRIEKVAELVYDADLPDIQTAKVARDLSEFLLKNAAATQQAVKIMGEMSQEIGNLKEEVKRRGGEYWFEHQKLFALQRRLEKASFFNRLVYLFTGRLG